MAKLFLLFALVSVCHAINIIKLKVGDKLIVIPLYPDASFPKIISSTALSIPETTPKNWMKVPSIVADYIAELTGIPKGPDAATKSPDNSTTSTTQSSVSTFSTKEANVSTLATKGPDTSESSTTKGLNTARSETNSTDAATSSTTKGPDTLVSTTTNATDVSTPTVSTTTQATKPTESPTKDIEVSTITTKSPLNLALHNLDNQSTSTIPSFENSLLLSKLSASTSDSKTSDTSGIIPIPGKVGRPTSPPTSTTISSLSESTLLGGNSSSNSGNLSPLPSNQTNPSYVPTFGSFLELLNPKPEPSSSNSVSSQSTAVNGSKISSAQDKKTGFASDFASM